MLGINDVGPGARAISNQQLKDKTNLLRFVPTVDQLEKVIRFLLPSRLTELQINALTPEELVIQLAAANVDQVLATFTPDKISGEASRHCVCVGNALAEFYERKV